MACDLPRIEIRAKGLRPRNTDKRHRGPPPRVELIAKRGHIGRVVSKFKLIRYEYWAIMHHVRTLVEKLSAQDWGSYDTAHNAG